MSFFTYILESETSGKWYYGSTDRLKERLREHNSGQTRSTKSRGPWRIIFLRPFETRREAVNFEFQLKKLRNKAYIREKFAEYFNRGM